MRSIAILTAIRSDEIRFALMELSSTSHTVLMAVEEALVLNRGDES